jgi:demethylmenaquinone methyltransferase/2-methoxy-6-polyprenyl-1,4-benzoquinol methylase
VSLLSRVQKRLESETFAIAESQVTRQKANDESKPDNKIRYVLRLFSDGPKEYDLLLRIFSLGRDSYWRRTILQKSGAKSNSTILDIACGTGLVTYAFANRGCYVVGIDVTSEMLRQAKALPSYRNADVDFVLARAENLPLRDNSFDAASISLALRNVSSQVETISEMKRCLKPGKPAMSLDFAQPKGSTFNFFYRIYIFKVLPSFGRLVSKHWKVIFLYLANSIEKSRDPEKIKETMEGLGLKDCEAKRMTHGTTALVSGIK